MNRTVTKFCFPPETDQCSCRRLIDVRDQRRGGSLPRNRTELPSRYFARAVLSFLVLLCSSSLFRGASMISVCISIYCADTLFYIRAREAASSQSPGLAGRIRGYFSASRFLCSFSFSGMLERPNFGCLVAKR